MQAQKGSVYRTVIFGLFMRKENQKKHTLNFTRTNHCNPTHPLSRLFVPVAEKLLYQKECAGIYQKPKTNLLHPSLSNGNKELNSYVHTHHNPKKVLLSKQKGNGIIKTKNVKREAQKTHKAFVCTQSSGFSSCFSLFTLNFTLLCIDPLYSLSSTGGGSAPTPKETPSAKPISPLSTNSTDFIP
jgi:hypothetical protein